MSGGVWVKIWPEEPEGLDTLATVSNFAYVSGAAGMSYVTNVVGLDGGGIAMMHTMLGDAGYSSRSIPAGTFDEQGFEMPTVFAEPSEPRTFSFDCSEPGILHAAMIAAGGAGGVSQWANTGLTFTSRKVRRVARVACSFRQLTLRTFSCRSLARTR